MTEGESTNVVTLNIRIFSSFTRGFVKVRTSPFYYLLVCLSAVGRAIKKTNSVNPNQTPHSAASDQGLHCLLRMSQYFGYIRVCDLFTISITC